MAAEVVLTCRQVRKRGRVAPPARRRRDCRAQPECAGGATSPAQAGAAWLWLLACGILLVLALLVAASGFVDHILTAGVEVNLVIVDDQTGLPVEGARVWAGRFPGIASADWRAAQLAEYELGEDGEPDAAIGLSDSSGRVTAQVEFDYSYAGSPLRLCLVPPRLPAFYYIDAVYIQHALYQPLLVKRDENWDWAWSEDSRFRGHVGISTQRLRRR